MRRYLGALIFTFMLSTLSVPNALSTQQGTPNLTLLLQFAPYKNTSYNQIWGWSDGKRYFALLGSTEGMNVLDVTNPAAVRKVAFIGGVPCINRDIKTYKNYAYITVDCVSDDYPGGVQIVQLDHPEGPKLVGTFTATVKTSHTLFIDTARGWAYINGANTFAPGGFVPKEKDKWELKVKEMRILDLSNPVQPKDLGAFTERYVHDGYALGNRYYAAEIWDKSIEVLDVSNPGMIRSLWQGKTLQEFPHNIWLSENKQTLFAADETEGAGVQIYDLRNPDAPKFIKSYKSERIHPRAIIHNFVTKGCYLYIGWFTEGLRILDVCDPANPVEVAFYDTFPEETLDSPGDVGQAKLQGAWGTYVDERNLIYVGDTDRGLFIFSFTPNK